MSSIQKQHEIEDLLFSHTDISTSYITRLLEEYADEVRRETLQTVREDWAHKVLDSHWEAGTPVVRTPPGTFKR